MAKRLPEGSFHLLSLSVSAVSSCAAVLQQPTQHNLQGKTEISRCTQGKKQSVRKMSYLWAKKDVQFTLKLSTAISQSVI